MTSLQQRDNGSLNNYGHNEIDHGQQNSQDGGGGLSIILRVDHVQKGWDSEGKLHKTAHLLENNTRVIDQRVGVLLPTQVVV